MATIQRNFSKILLFGIVFIELNILDAQLTELALNLGSSELNPILGSNYGSSIVFKTMVSFAVIAVLLWCKNGRLLKHLNFGMCAIVVWNAFTVWTWYIAG